MSTVLAPEAVFAAKRRVLAWQLYDWANSSFATVVLATVLPVYFSLIHSMRYPNAAPGSGTSIWAGLNAVTMLLVALVAVLVGPSVDHLSRKKRALATFALIGAGSTALVGILPASFWWMILILFAVSNLGFAGGNIFYDSLLPAVAPREDLDRVSSGGFAMGYLGGGVLLALCVALMFFMPKQAVELAPGQVLQQPMMAMRISFLLVGVWWVVFSIPLFRYVQEPKAAVAERPAELMRASLGSIKKVLIDAVHHRELFKFLVAFWFYSDGIGTIVKMATIYGREEIFAKSGQDPTMYLILALLLVQFAGGPFALLWGKISRRIGTRTSILICLGVYACICLLGFFMKTIVHFYLLGLLVASVQGGSQALSRSLFARLVPKGREAEYFGLYNISGKFAGILGPALFPLLALFHVPSRYAILALILFFVFGGAMLSSVKVQEE